MLRAGVEGREWRPDDAKTGEMVFISGGTFRMGSDHHYPEEAPSHRAAVDGFWIDATPVTNRQFKEFVNATGHVTEAQIVPKAKDYPGARPEMLYAGSLVFSPLPHITNLNDWSQWWSFMRGANWRHPYGPKSNIKGLDDYPVVHVSYSDAAAYARWAGKDLPTEAEWEYAARAGVAGARYPWGDAALPVADGRPLANVADESAKRLFPGWKALAGYDDGFAQVAPVGAFPTNAFGIADLAGNVNEWCADWFGDKYYAASPVRDPQGPRAGLQRVTRGGAWNSFPSYLRASYRNRSIAAEHTVHLGFRCARDAAP